MTEHEQAKRAESAGSLLELVGRNVVLTPFSDAQRGSCPLHPDPTSSLFVNDYFFHCFACGAHGGAAKWLKISQRVSSEQAIAHPSVSSRLPPSD